MSRHATGLAAAAFAGLIAGPLAVGCTPAEGPDGSPEPSPASSYVIPSPLLDPRPFTVRDLPAVALGRGDAPAGTEFAPQYSVDQTIDEFASDDEELTALRVDAFVVAHVTLYVPEGQLQETAPPVEPGDVFVQGVAGLFETSAGADSSLRRYVANLRAFQLRHETRISAGGLGDSSEGLRGKADGESVTVFAWRTDNLLLVVSGSGAIGSGDVRALADLTQRRADRAR